MSGSDGSDYRDSPEFKQAVAELLVGIEAREAAQEMARRRRAPSYEPETLPDGASRPFATTIEEFAAEQEDVPPPLLGTEDDCVIPAHGLGIWVAKGGKGKTTLAVDLALHLASGLPWLGIDVPRPLRVLIIENEGPRHMFRRKLRQRLAHWSHPIRGAADVFEESWAGARLDSEEFVRRLNAYCVEHAIDIVIGDPLDSLGMEGEGSPSETRRMVALMTSAGLFRDRAWLVLHHSRKEKAEDVVDAAAGAWGQRPDLMVVVEKLKGDRARIVWAKVRWGRDRPPWILSFDPETEEFAFLAEQHGVDERDLFGDVVAWLSDHEWSTASEIGAPKKNGGVGGGASAVNEVLRANPDTFESRTGDGAKALGRKANATVWRLLAKDATTSSTSRTTQGPQGSLLVLTPTPMGSVQAGQPPSEVVRDDATSCGGDREEER